MAKKKQPARSKKKGARKQRAPFFSRSPIAKTPKRSPRETERAWEQWGRGRQAADPTETRRRQVVLILEARGVYPEVARKIAYGMDPDRFYIMRIYGFASSDPNDEGMPGDVPVLQATYVGSGTRLWSRAIGYASVAPIEHVEIEELDGGVIDRPLWGSESVKTVSGERVYGSGMLEEYRDRAKIGRPKKPGGGMTAKERRADRKRKDAALGRRRETEARARKLEDAGDYAGAARLRARSKRARKVDL